MFGLFARKGPFDAKLTPGGDVVSVKAGENLLKSALEAGLAWPHNCRVGSCGTCRARLVSGKIKALNDFSYVLDKEELDNGMILACQTCLRSDVLVEVVLETGPALSAAKEIGGRIVSSHALTHDIVELRVRLDSPLPAYLAGQYAELSVPGHVDLPRSYSFARAPENEDALGLTFFIRQVPGGELTTWLHAADRSGETVKIKGPFGSFWLREAEAPILCVAGGSGLAPIKALIEQIAAGGFQRHVVFLFGARTRADLYCLDAMAQFEAKAKGQFHFIPVLSAEPEDSDWAGARGNVTEHIREAVMDVHTHHAYLCGPPPMVDAAEQVLAKAGLDSAHVHFDKFLDASHMPGGRSA